jgi:hypothetical protein
LINAVKIIEEKTGLDGVNAALLYEMAKDKLRIYLNVPDSFDLKRFDTHLIEIATLIHEEDEAKKKAKAEGLDAAVSGESFKEGTVSVSKTYKSMQDLKAEYDTAIKLILEDLKPYRLATFPSLAWRK